MTQLAIRSRGAILRIGDGATPTEGFTAIAELGDVSDAYPSQHQYEDVTTHDSPANRNEVMPTVVEDGEMTMVLNWLPAHGTHDHSTGLRADHENQTLRNFQLKLPGSDNLRKSFSAYVARAPVSMPVNGIMRSTVVLRVTGGVTTETDA